MKVIFVSNLYPSKDKPFKGTFVRNILEGFRDRDCDVSLIALQDFGNNKLMKLFGYLLFTFKAFYSGLMSNSTKVHYIHYTSHSSLGLILASFFKSKESLVIVSNVHGSDIIPEGKSFFSKAKMLLSRQALNISTLVVSPSVYFKGVLFEQYDVLPEKVIVSPSGGVDDLVFNTSYHSTKTFTFGYVGRIEEGKGVFDLLNAYRSIQQEYPDVSLLIVGSGSCEERLEEMTRSLSGVTVMEGKDQQELVALYQAIKILVFPSKLSESLGLIPIEAMMCGTPVACSNIGAAKDYITSDMVKLSFEPGNVNELQVALKSSINMTVEEYSALVDLAVDTANNYSSCKVIDNLHQEFKTRLTRGYN
ncbi:glycosyltransferase family 4 protein [Vibrio sp. IB15]|uniref:glycosyltransferase family 4 protein n=1 Tax=Vibrio sp. IB15 TaxID=2779368 RepID=UPI0018E6F4A2|nr:glycosyltransferase family 4 protein [Vibrio sp. IB15]MBJ2145470.1 glycosyltransferase family 4 protein [Vibrio sp. IB15]